MNLTADIRCMCVRFNYNARMLVNTYKNEQMLFPNTSAQYRQCLQCYCYTLTAMPTRQAGNQPIQTDNIQT